MSASSSQRSVSEVARPDKELWEAVTLFMQHLCYRFAGPLSSMLDDSAMGLQVA